MDDTSKTINDIQSQVKLLIAGGEELIENEPLAAIDRFEEAWRLAIENDFSESQHTLIPHLGRLYFVHGQDKQKILDLNIQAMRLAEEEQDDELIAKSALALSWVYSQTQRFAEDIEVVRKGLDAARRIRNKTLEASLLNNLAICYSNVGNLDRSLSHFLDLLKMGEEMGNRDVIRHVYLNIQKVYMALEDFKRTEEYGLKALEIAEEMGDSGAIAGVKINLSVVYQQTKEYDKSLQMINESIDVLKNISHRKNALTSAYMNRGILLMNLKQYPESEIDLRKAIELAIAIDHKEWLLKGTNALGRLKLETNCFPEAEELINRTLEIAKDIDQSEFYIVVYRSLYELNKNRKNFETACEMQEKVVEYEKLYFSEKLALRLADMEVRYEMEKKVQEAEFYRSRSEDLEKMNAELQQAYDKLKHSQDAVRDLERKSSIMAMAVTANHELNQPLMIIHGNLELLRSRLNPNDAMKARYYQRIETALHRIESILQKYRSQGEMHLTEYTDATMMFEFDDSTEQDV